MAEVQAVRSPFAVARERLGLPGAPDLPRDRGLLSSSWPPRVASLETPEEGGCSDDESVAMWQELTAEGGASGSMASAAASAATALARGGPLPAGTAAAVRRNSVPGLLALDVHLPPWQPSGEFELSYPPQAAGGGQPGTSGAPTSPDYAQPGGSPGSDRSGGSSPVRRSGSDGPTTLRMAMASGGYPQGTCTFTLSSPASEAERQQLASFCGRLGCELERARVHLAKQHLEGSLDELSQALASGGATSLRSASLPEGLTLPTMPSWRSTASAPAGTAYGSCSGSASSSAVASPMFRASTSPQDAGQEASPVAMEEGA